MSGIPAGWTMANVTVSLSRNEAGATYYRLAGGSQLTYSSAFAVSSPGQTALEFWSVDTAGNVETHQTRTISIDKGLPGISTDAKASYVSPAVINISATDSLSQVRTIEYKLDGGAWTAGTRATTSATGAHTLYYRATDFAGNVANASVAFTVTGIAPPPPPSGTTTTALSAAFAQTAQSTYVMAYNGTASVGGYLTNTGTAAKVASQTVILEYSYNGTTFYRSATSPIEISAGSYRASVRCTTRTWYRLRFLGSDVYKASVSRSLDARPRAYLTAPVSPTTLSRARYYNVYGYLKPRHSANAVRLYAYRYERSGRSFVWKLRATTYARAYNYSSYSKYLAKMRLPLAGRWRIRAYHYDAGHYPTYSSYSRTITVR